MKNTSYPNTQHGSLFARPRSSILRPLWTALTYFTSLFQVLFQCIFNYCVTSSKFKLSHHSATQRLTNISLFLVSFHHRLKDREESSDRNSPKKSVFWEGRETTALAPFMLISILLVQTLPRPHSLTKATFQGSREWGQFALRLRVKCGIYAVSITDSLKAWYRWQSKAEGRQIQTWRLCLKSSPNFSSLELQTLFYFILESWQRKS